MQAFRLTAKAMDDMRSIGRYTETNWGREQRNKYLSMIENCFHVIENQPEIGIVCNDIRAGYRKYHVGRHLIFYRQSSKYIDIIRILHDSMYIDTHF
jgi:toxin ParE1/3/4